MTNDASIRRMAENEVFFRQQNERVNKKLKELTALAKDHNQANILKHHGKALQFHCECSDENCDKRIKIQPQRYTEIHKKRDRFIVASGHEVAVVEKVIERNETFCIVEKLLVPPNSVGKLHKTDVDNTDQ